MTNETGRVKPLTALHNQSISKLPVNQHQSGDLDPFLNFADLDTSKVIKIQTATPYLLSEVRSPLNNKEENPLTPSVHKHSSSNNHNTLSPLGALSPARILGTGGGYLPGNESSQAPTPLFMSNTDA